MLVEMQRDFRMSPDATMVVSQISAAACLVAVFLAGTLADRLGNRRMLVGAGVVFAAGALVVGTAPTVVVLAVGLSIAGIGTIVMAIVGLAALNATFSEKGQRARAFGIFALIAPVVSIVVPLLTSAVISLSSWRLTTVLWILVGVGSAWSARRTLVGDEQRSARSELVTPALAGVALSGTALAFSFFSVSGSVTARFGHGVIAASVALGSIVVLTVLMTRRKRPTLDLRSLRTRGAFPILIALFLVNGVNLFFFTYLLLQYRYHQSLFETAVLLIAPQLTASLGALTSGRLSAKWGTQAVATWALTGAAIASAGTFVVAAQSSAWVPVAILSIAALPIAAAVGPMTQSFMDLAPEDGTGAASSVRNASVNLGVAIAGLITGTIVFNGLERDTELTLEAFTLQAEAFHLAGVMCVVSYLVAAGLVVLHTRRRVVTALKERPEHRSMPHLHPEESK